MDGSGGMADSIERIRWSVAVHAEEPSVLTTPRRSLMVSRCESTVSVPARLGADYGYFWARNISAQVPLSHTTRMADVPSAAGLTMVSHQLLMLFAAHNVRGGLGVISVAVRDFA